MKIFLARKNLNLKIYMFKNTIPDYIKMYVNINKDIFRKK